MPAGGADQRAGADAPARSKTSIFVNRLSFDPPWPQGYCPAMRSKARIATSIAPDGRWPAWTHTPQRWSSVARAAALVILAGLGWSPVAARPLEYLCVSTSTGPSTPFRVSFDDETQDVISFHHISDVITERFDNSEIIFKVADYSLSQQMSARVIFHRGSWNFDIFYEPRENNPNPPSQLTHVSGTCDMTNRLS